MTNNYGTVKTTRCPVCNCKLDCATDPLNDKHVPREGDISVCIGCGEVLIFNLELGLRVAQIADLINLTKENHEVIEKVQEFIRRVRPK